MELSAGNLTCYIFIVAIVVCEAGSCRKGLEKKCPDGTCVPKGEICSQDGQHSANAVDVKNMGERETERGAGGGARGGAADLRSTPAPEGEGVSVGEVPCPQDKPNRCNNRNCYSQRERCDGRDQCGDRTDEEGCGRSKNILGVWPWYHWVLACAFGGAACILAVYGVYLVIARRRQLAQEDGFRIGDRESLDNSGTPVRFVSRDAMQNKYNSINQDNDRNN